MSAYDSLGAIAQQFTQGFKSSKAQEHQQGMEDAQLAYDRAGRLFQMADQVQDPRMKDALFSSATQLVDSAGGPGSPAKKSNPKSFGSILGGLFGIGHTAPPHPSVIGGAPGGTAGGATASPTPAAPSAAEGSNTFGSIGQQFGPEVRQNAAPATDLPEVPAPMHEKAGAPGAILDNPNAPQNTPREMAMIMAGIPLHEEGAAAQASPIAAQFPGGQGGQGAPAAASAALNFPSVVDIRRRAIADTASPQYGFRDQYKQSLAEQDHASTIARTLFSTMDAHLKENPAVTTLAAADKDPSFGAEFRQTMDAIAQYEEAGMLPKGTLENWQKQRFDDVRFGSDKYNPGLEAERAAKTITHADGSIWRLNTKTGAFDIPEGAAKTKELTPNETLQEAYNTDAVKRTASQVAAIRGDSEQIEAKRRANAPLSQDEIAKEEYYKAIGTPGEKAAHDKLKNYMDTAHPQPPPVPITMAGINPTTNRSEIMIINRITGKAESTGIRTAGAPFIPERYQKEVVVQTPNKINPRIMDESKDKVFNADALMAAHSSGDPSVSLDTLVDLLNSHANFDDRAKLNAYVNSKLPTPAFTSTTK